MASINSNSRRARRGIRKIKQILDRLDAIEKRLDNIEKLLAQSCQCSNYDELVTCACANGFKPI